MSLTRNKIFFGILIFILVTNFLVLYNIQYFYLRAIFSSIFLIIIPGLVIMLMLKIRGIGVCQYLVYSIGLSIAFIIFWGLLVNWMLPLVGIDRPLSLIPLSISFNILIFIFWGIAYRLNKENVVVIKPPKLNRLSIIFFTISIFFPIISILGTNLLNNLGPNYLTMIMLGGIAVFVFLIVLLRNKLNEEINPWVILFISVSLLLMFSLRSMHISGWDIHREFQMFQLTRNSFHWSLSNSPGEPYNTCLSITILPTIFYSFLNINGEYIFKVVFQIIFCIVPVIIFLFIRRYTKNIIAFLAVFFFVSKPEFIEGMPSLIRQEISFLFFTLFLALLFNKDLKSGIKKNFLLIILGFSMIVSHYSTSYVAIFLFTFAYIVWFFFRKTENRKVFKKIYQKLNLKEKGESKRKKYYLSGTVVLMLIVFSFLWSFQITETSSNLIYFSKMTARNIGKIFTNEMKSEEALAALGVTKKTYTVEDIENYAINISKEYHSDKELNYFYSSDEYADYTIEPKYGEDIPSPNNIVKINEYLTIIFTRLLQIFMLIGVFYLLFFQLKKQKIDGEYIIMSVGCLVLMALMIFIPYVSLAYNFERLFLQCLVLLSFPTVFGIMTVFKFLKNKNILFILMACIFVWIFLSNSGFNSNIFGGSPKMTLNNFGEAYERFYTHDSEVRSLEWLSKNYNKKDKIYIDEYSRLRLLSLSKINEENVLKDILPSTIYKNAYVYSSYTNTINQTTRVIYQEDFLEYNFPLEFLNENKNKIYDNGESDIYK